MIAAHLPALQVVLPLISAPLMVLVRRGGIAYGLMLTVAWISLLISLLLAQQVAEFGPISATGHRPGELNTASTRCHPSCSCWFPLPERWWCPTVAAA